ncbi:MAG: amino acid kinase [Gammaproteobacteria bacterium]
MPSRKDGPHDDALVVIKFGGSLMSSANLHAWLRALHTAASGHRLVVVPGGGVFADAVREAQRRYGFDDASAHDMALLAMAQFGHMLCSLSRASDAQMMPATLDELDRTAERGRATLWIPDPVELGRIAAIEPGWDLTSDSLAAWLAGRLGARALVLLKSAPVQQSHPRLADIIDARLVDEAFGRFMPSSTTDLHLLGPDDPHELIAVLDGA